MDNFVLRVQAQLDTSKLTGDLDKFKGKIKVDVDTGNITKKIEAAVKASSKQKLTIPTEIISKDNSKTTTIGQIKQLQKIEAITNKLNTKSFDTSLAQMKARRSRYEGNTSKEFTNATAALKALETELKKVNAAKTQFEKSGTKTDGDALVKAYNKLTTSMKLAQNEMKTLSYTQKDFVSSAAKASAIDSFEQYLSKNTKAAKAYKTEIDAIKISLQNMQTTTDSSTVQSDIKSLKEKASLEGNTGRSHIDELINGGAKLGSILGVGNIVTEGIQKVKAAVSELKEMDSILTQIGQVSNMTSSQIRQLGKNSFAYADKYGQTVTNYLKGVAEMNKNGFRGSQSIALADTAMLAQASGGMAADVANQYVLAASAAYEYAGNAEKLNSVLDGQTMIANRNNVNMTDMANATTLAGTTAAQTGVQINQLSALVGTAVARTKKDGNEVGEALKEIFTNLQDTENAKISNTFKDIGLSMTKMAGNSKHLKTPVEALKELSQVYNALPDGSAQKNNILTNIGGNQNNTVLSSILSGYSDYEKMLQDYSDGGGSAAVKAEKSANSWEGSLNKLSNSWTKFVSNFAQSDQITGGIKLVNGFVEAIDGLVKTITPLGAIGAGAGIFSFIKSFD